MAEWLDQNEWAHREIDFSGCKHIHDLCTSANSLGKIRMLIGNNLIVGNKKKRPTRLLSSQFILSRML